MAEYINTFNAGTAYMTHQRERAYNQNLIAYEEKLWEKVYDNALAEVSGQAEASPSLNYEWLRIQSQVLRMSGRFSEALEMVGWARYIKQETGTQTDFDI